ncbi:hypothetical protein F1880_010320 [Penicillium rolfsii]|nr:hypothetical protein F1880_010320 [Penicillium rolfsii]
MRATAALSGRDRTHFLLKHPLMTYFSTYLHFLYQIRCIGWSFDYAKVFAQLREKKMNGFSFCTERNHYKTICGTYDDKFRPLSRDAVIPLPGELIVFGWLYTRDTRYHGSDQRKHDVRH